MREYRKLSEHIGNNSNKLNNAKLLYFLMAVLLITDWLVPQYFGFHILFDFTVTRVLNIVILIYFLFNQGAFSIFLSTIRKSVLSLFLGLYMLVMIYTTILRINVNTFFLNFLDILTFYMVLYGVKYLIGVKKAIKWTVIVAWIVGIYGIIEYVLRYSPLLKLMKTLPNNTQLIYRSGQYRIMGFCVHPIAYGMVLLFLMAMVCVDYDNDEIYIFRNPALYLLLFLNMFLTGSRGPQGLALLETFIIIILTQKNKRAKTFIILIFTLVALVCFELAIINTSLGRNIMMQITSIIDQVFGTSYSVRYGADMLLLQQSSGYREYLTQIFSVKWLNPLLGQGANARVGFEFDGVYIHSIDNFYVNTYIRYGYPGLFSFALFQLVSALILLIKSIKYKSGICTAVFVSFVLYSVGLWWVDYLQTTKYMYIVLAIAFAHCDEKRAEKMSEH